MKTKALGICLFVFMLVPGLKTSARAEGRFDHRIDLHREVSVRGANYGIQFKLFGKILGKAGAVAIKVPHHPRSVLENPLGFNELMFSADKMTGDEFRLRFPEGEYRISLFPRDYGTYSVHRSHDFPEVTVTYPVEGTVNVPTTPTFTWEPLANVDTLYLSVKSEGTRYGVGLDPESSSYTPYWRLTPNCKYTIGLEASSVDPKGNRTVTTYEVSFTTGN